LALFAAKRHLFRQAKGSSNFKKSMGESNNDIFIMIISVTVVLLLLLIFIVSFLFIYKNRQMRHRVEMESVKEKYNEEILKTRLEIKEQTLKNLAEEIHDNVGQVLSLVVLNLSGMELTDTEKTAAKIESTTRLVQKAVADLRNLSKTLDADNIADVGLVSIVQFELELLEKTGVYKTSFKLSGEEKRLNVHKELLMYRVIQESFNNIIKHAGASAVDVVMDFSALQLCIEVKDNGTGFDTSAANGKNIYSNGAGLKNMNKRTNLTGGVFTVKSVPSMGTTISMTIPFSD
jgi:two-component system, NarL family, sensor kinase